MSAAARQWSHRRRLAIATAAYAALAIYGSLAPLRMEARRAQATWDEYTLRMSAPIEVKSRSDWMANILLFAPLGFLAVGALTIDRPLPVACGLAALVIIGCAALSAGIELTQVWFPDRTVSPNDVVAETVGAALGAGLWLFAGQPLLAAWRRLRQRLQLDGQLGPVALLYSMWFALWQFMPLELTLSPADVYRKYRRGHVLVVPFYDPSASLGDWIWLVLVAALTYLPLGCLLAYWQAIVGAPLSAAQALGWGVLISGCAEAAQLFVLSRDVTATEIVLGGAFTLIGWLAARRAGVTARDGVAPIDPRRATRGVAILMLIAWCVLIATMIWEPFDFAWDLGAASAKAREVTLIPFADYERQENFNWLRHAVEHSGLFLALGVLTGVAGGRWRIAVLAGAVVFAVVVEAGQLLLPGRNPSITDVMLAAICILIGWFASRRIVGSAGQEESPTGNEAARGWIVGGTR